MSSRLHSLHNRYIFKIKLCTLIEFSDITEKYTHVVYLSYALVLKSITHTKDRCGIYEEKLLYNFSFHIR